MNVGHAEVSPDYVKVLGIRLVSGRDFTVRDDSTAPAVAIVNRSAAEALWPGRDPIGRQFRARQDGPAVEVVGLIENLKYLFVNEEPRPFIYFPLAQESATMTFAVVLTRSDPSAMTPALRAAIADVNPNILIYGVRTMRAHLDQGIAFFFVRIAATLATAIGILGLLQTIVGLYGVLSYAVVQKSKDIGIRMALGAGRGEVVGGVLRQGSVLVGLGLLIGGGLAVSLTQVMRGIFFGVSRGDVMPYLGSMAVVVVLAFISAWLPANRAARVAPASALRSD
jgi:ABC-type antimicrobial peptide transport system permease subunit